MNEFELDTIDYSQGVKIDKYSPTDRTELIEVTLWTLSTTADTNQCRRQVAVESKVPRRFPPSLVDGFEARKAKSSVRRRDRWIERRGQTGIWWIERTVVSHSCPRSSTIHEVAFGRSSLYGVDRFSRRSHELSNVFESIQTNVSRELSGFG